MTTLTLFTTSHCHLCEQAIALLTELHLDHHLTLVEIADDDQLLACYGTRIPVLKRMDNLSELNWPFTEGDLAVFVRA